jgi:hypothetical protein
MSIETLTGFIGSSNIFEDVRDREGGERVLDDLAAQVIEDFQRDQSSMTDWSNQIEAGKEVAKQENESKSEPWEGAANFKTTAMLEASVAFGDRAATELLRSRNILKIDVIGSDKEGGKRKSAENVTEYMNWQINYEMEDWRDIQETLFYELPNVGCLFKKVYYDSIEGINRSELIHYPDFAVNQATASVKDCLSFTQIMDVSASEVIEKQNSGLWADVEIYPEDADSDEGSNEQQEVEDAEENSSRFFEQRCYYDLDDDGYAEPYIVTVHEETQQVVRIVPRYFADNIYVRNETGSIGKLGEVENPVKVVKIVPIIDIVKYGFVKSQDGTFLDIGYYHILTSLCKAQNSTTNQLLDSGTLANLQGGYVAKGFRKRMGNTKFKPGSYTATDISPSDLRNGVVSHQFKEPSQTLFALNEKITKEIDEASVKMDLQGVLAPNAPATTTLALIQENMLPTSAIMQRIIRAESREFRKLFDLNSRYIDPSEYRVVLDDESASYRADFNPRSMDVVPTASAEMSSKIQRIQQSQVMLLEVEKIAFAGGDVRPIYERWFDAMGADDMINQVWPDPEQMSEEQKSRQDELAKQRKNEMMLQAIQIDQAERALVMQERLASMEVALKQSELEKNLISLRKTESEIILNLEKAESEEVKNQIDVYTAQLGGIRQAIDATIREIEVNNAARAAEQDRATPTDPPNPFPRLPSVAG